MEWLKNLFMGGGGGSPGMPTALPGAPAPAPSKAADIMSLLGRGTMALGAGMGAATGNPVTYAPPSQGRSLADLQKQIDAMRTGGGIAGGGGGASPLAGRDDTIGALLRRIFTSTNPTVGALPKSGIMPTDRPNQIGTGTGGLY